MGDVRLGKTDRAFEEGRLGRCRWMGECGARVPEMDDKVDNSRPRCELRVRSRCRSAEESVGGGRGQPCVRKTDTYSPSKCLSPSSPELQRRNYDRNNPPSVPTRLFSPTNESESLNYMGRFHWPIHEVVGQSVSPSVAPSCVPHQSTCWIGESR